MHLTRQSWLPAAQSAGWFRLDRHDDPEPTDPPEPEPAKDPDTDPEPEPGDDPPLGPRGEKALEAMKADRATAKREAAEAKRRAEAAERKVQEFEDRDRTELEKATAKAERESERAAKATARAVKAEVRAAAAEFADPDDAAAFLDLSKYAGDDGDVDIETLQSDLADLLSRKPHLRRPTSEPQPEPRKNPKPDPSQGPRKEPEPVNYANASREDIKKALAEHGVRLRS